MPQATSAMQNNINFSSARVVTPMQQTEQQRPQPMQQTISPPTTYTMLLNTGGAASINKQPDSGGVLLASTQAAGARTAVWNNSVSTPLSVQDTGGGLQQGSVIQIQSAVVAQQPQQQNLNQVFAKPKVRGNGNDISVSLKYHFSDTEKFWVAKWYIAGLERDWALRLLLSVPHRTMYCNICLESINFVFSVVFHCESNSELHALVFQSSKLGQLLT